MNTNNDYQGKCFVQYARLSTDEVKQEHGMEVQRRFMDDFVLRNGGKTIGVFEEYSSGANNKRKKVQEAIELAQKEGAILLVSKLDRIARDVKFIYDLKDKVKFVTADNPEMGTLMLSVFAGFAQAERELISERVKAGLAVAKSKGRNVGGRRWINAPDKLISVTKERHERKRQELREFALKYKGRTEGSISALLFSLEQAGYRNHAGNAYTELNLKKLGVLEVLND
jgi:DNA invertase Pin-like site-specific DNA recombinase